MEIINFQNKDIRTIEDNGEIWYSLIDVIDVLTNSKNARAYWNTLKFRLGKEGANETLTNCKQFKLLAPDGKMRLTVKRFEQKTGLKVVTPKNNLLE